MKIWYGYGSEHSSNLVMIGRFNDVSTANQAKQIIDWLTAQMDADVRNDVVNLEQPLERFTDGMQELLRKLHIYSIGASEIEQLNYGATVKVEGSAVVITTEESDVSVFLKLLLHKGARVEVFSAHDHPDTGYGRGSG